MLSKWDTIFFLSELISSSFNSSCTWCANDFYRKPIWIMFFPPPFMHLMVFFSVCFLNCHISSNIRHYRGKNLVVRRTSLRLFFFAAWLLFFFEEAVHIVDEPGAWRVYFRMRKTRFEYYRCKGANVKKTKRSLKGIEYIFQWEQEVYLQMNDDNKWQTFSDNVRRLYDSAIFAIFVWKCMGQTQLDVKYMKIAFKVRITIWCGNTPPGWRWCFVQLLFRLGRFMVLISTK